MGGGGVMCMEVEGQLSDANLDKANPRPGSQSFHTQMENHRPAVMERRASVMDAEEKSPDDSGKC